MPKNNNIQISIIIVNYNTSEYLIKCLESTYDKTESTYDKTSGVEIEVIVIDNNSTDRSIENLNEIFPEVKLVLRNVNDGFGCGCNEGAKYAKGSYLAFVNPDTFIKDNVLYELCNFMEQNLDVGICSGSFYDYDSKIRASYSIYPNLYTELLDAIGRGTNKRLMKYMENENIKKNKPFEVEWLMGAYMFFRKESFLKINGFDKDFFLYLEDAEI
ncbi:MAG: glycosyltransferase, partial [Ignavibacteriae bacterium]|nr:glycosyltransferase [Ignavibacteriota bacterium]